MDDGAVGGFGDFDGFGGDLGGVVGVLGDLADGGAEFFAAGGDGLDVAGDLFGGGGGDAGLGGGLLGGGGDLGAVVSCWLAEAASEEAVLAIVEIAARMLLGGPVERTRPSRRPRPSDRTSTAWVRSPSATAASTSETRRSGRTMSRTIQAPMSAASAMPAAERLTKKIKFRRYEGASSAAAVSIWRRSYAMRSSSPAKTLRSSGSPVTRMALAKSPS